ncbi:hypothetical protein ScPMuIL_004912 [Solemya velum]
MPPKWQRRFMKKGEKARRESSSKRMAEENPNASKSCQKEQQCAEVNGKCPDNLACIGTDFDASGGKNESESCRRVDELRSCSDCEEALQLHRITEERRYGLSSLLYVECVCGTLNSITTSKSHHAKESKRGVPAYDVNTKAALGMYHAGVGQTQVASFLSTLEIEGLHAKSMKARELEFSEHMKAVAQASCDEALQKEVAISLDVCKICEKKNLERGRNKTYQSSQAFKKRRLELKFQKRNATRAKEVREGITYKTAIATTHHSDTQEIPDAIFPPAIICVCESMYQKVFFDTETTSLHQDADIVQISAVCDTDTFDQYIASTKPVAPGASAVTRLTSQGGVLFYHGTPVNTLPMQAAKQNFIGWLDERAPVILIGHNF